MQIKIKCPNAKCGKTLIVDSDMAGKKGKCSTCDSIFMIPAAPGGKSASSGGSASDPGETKESPKPAAKSRTKKSSRKSARPKSKSSEKFLDDYVEEKPKAKKKKQPSKSGAMEFTLTEDDYIDYSDGEDEPPRRSSGSKRKPQRSVDAPSGGRDSFYDDYDQGDEADGYDEYPDDDYEDYEDYDAPRSRGRRGGGRRQAEDYDDYDDYDAYEDDEYDDDYEDDMYGAPVRRGGRRRRRGPNIGLIKAGMMILAVSGCVFAGAVGIKIIVELIARLKDFTNVGSTSETIWKVAETLWFGAAIAVIVGYSFLILFPNKNSSRGLTIAALCLGVINIIIQLVLKIIPMYSDGKNFMALGFSSRGSEIEALLKIGLIEGLFIAEMILVALAFVAINKQLKDRYNMTTAKQMIIPAGIYGGILVVVGLFAIIIKESDITSLTALKIWIWVIYLMRVGSQGMLVWYFVSYIILMLNTRSATRKA